MLTRRPAHWRFARPRCRPEASRRASAQLHVELADRLELAQEMGVAEGVVDVFETVVANRTAPLFNPAYMVVFAMPNRRARDLT